MPAGDLVRFMFGLLVNFFQFEQAVVGETIVLEMGPDVFHWVEFQRIRREALNRESRVRRPPQLDLGAAMGVEPISYENDVASKMG